MNFHCTSPYAALHGGHVPFYLSLSVSCSALHLIYSQSKAPGGVLHCREEGPSGCVGAPCLEEAKEAHFMTHFRCY